MRQISDEDWAVLTALRIPTPEERQALANIAGAEFFRHTNDDDFGIQIWDPLTNDRDAFQLLETIIRIKDCRMFYDDGIQEFFIYEDGLGKKNNAPVAHRKVLRDAIVEAAMNLWFPED